MDEQRLMMSVLTPDPKNGGIITEARPGYSALSNFSYHVFHILDAASNAWFLGPRLSHLLCQDLHPCSCLPEEFGLVYYTALDAAP